MKKIVIIGAGDGGRLVSELVRTQGEFEILGFIDDNEEVQGKTINGYKVIGKGTDLKNFKKEGFVVALGTNMQARSRLFDLALKNKLEPVSVIHKTAVIDKSVEIAKGAIILANCVINPFSKVGKNVFIFTGTILEHDDKIGDNVYFSPAVKLAGHVKVGNNTFFGINSCVIEGITIGSNVIVGAGSVILEDIPDSVVVAGVPAKVLRKNDR
jgi:sugar O-acyltransferase (sialic acid O-acetyltransferase NeuD family)